MVRSIMQTHIKQLLKQLPRKARFPLGDFFRANKQKTNVIGWWCCQCLSPTNQIAFFHCSREQIRQVENRFYLIPMHRRYLTWSSMLWNFHSDFFLYFHKHTWRDHLDNTRLGNVLFFTINQKLNRLVFCNRDHLITVGVCWIALSDLHCSPWSSYRSSVTAGGNLN